MRLLRQRRLVSMSGGAGAAFTPASISGLKLWLDASQITGLNDGDALGTWPDLSGNGNDVIQGAASKRPLYKAGILNGKPVVRYDGVDDALANAGFTDLAGAPSASLFTVKVQPASVGVLVALYSGCGFGTFNIANTKYWRVDNSCDVTGTPNWTAWHYESLIFDGSQAGDSNRAKFRHNASPVTVSYGGAVPANLQLGNGVFVGALDDLGGLSWNGDIAEVLLYSTPISGANLTAVESYLAAKYAL